MALSSVSYEMVIPWQTNLIWWCIITCQSVIWKKKLDNCIQGQGHSEGSKSQCSSRWYFLNHPTFCSQTWYCDEPPWARVHANRLVCYFRGQGHSKGSEYDSFFYICSIADPFATKLGLMVHYHKPECLMEKWDCCVQGQGHSKISNVNEYLYVQIF